MRVIGFISLSLILFVFASCSFLKTMGIEKRKYQPGFYIDIGKRGELKSLSRLYVSKKPANDYYKGDNFNSKSILLVSNPNQTTIVIKSKRDKPAFHKIAEEDNIIISNEKAARVFQVSEKEDTTDNIEGYKGEGGGLYILLFLSILAIAGIAFGLHAIFPVVDIGICVIIGFVVVILAFVLIAKAFGFSFD